MKTLPLLSAAAAFALASAALAQTHFAIQLSGNQEVPPNGTAAAGAGHAVLDNSTNMVTLNYSFAGLSAPQTAAHIHQAAIGANGPIIVTLPVGSPVSGTFPLTGVQAQAMRDGNCYVNCHTTAFPGGEIRGQLEKLFPVTASMSGASEVPPNGSPATGTTVVFLNRYTNQLFFHMEFSGLTAPQTAAHIHQAAAGSNGPIIIPLPTGSPVDAVFTLTDAQEDALIAGNCYVNVHTSAFPGGEIRGQINPLQVVNFPMSGAQEVPPNGSPATGTGSVTFNLFTRQFDFSYAFSGLSAPQTAAHIHQAAAGANGPIIFPLAVGSPATLAVTLTGPQADQFLAGNYYANVHTTAFPGGEIRGQLVNPPPSTGACCLGVECTVLTSEACAAAGGTYQGDNSACNAGICVPPPKCACDWNTDATVNSQDFFDFLVDFFANEADFNGDATTNSQDFFDFLTCFFELPKGC